MKRTSGFTLIELVMVMVVISVGFVGLARLFANTNVGLARAEGAQVAAQYAQECAERVLGARRDLGFSSPAINNTMCTLGVPSLGATYTGSSTSVCPNSVTCRDVTVTGTSGSYSSTIVFTLVQY